MGLWRRRHRPNITHVMFCFILVYIVSGIWYVQLFDVTPLPKPPPDLHWLQKSSQPYNLTFLNLMTDYGTLLNLQEFKFLINSQSCANQDVFILIFVHSAPDHFDRRATIRRTWAGKNKISGKIIKCVFLIGSVNDMQLQKELFQEQQQFKDMVQGNFIDSYRNLTYKFVMGLKWISHYCRQAKYILKTDDDMFVDMFQMVDYLTASFGYPTPSDLIMCFVIPYANPKRSQRSKWRVSFKEYKNQKYPTYCSGWAIIMSPDVVFNLYQESFNVPYFWVDDVFVSGILAQKIGVKHIDLTYRLSITTKRIEDWLADGNLTRPNLFGYPDMNTSTINALWKKSLSYYTLKGQQYL